MANDNRYYDLGALYESTKAPYGVGETSRESVGTTLASQQGGAENQSAVNQLLQDRNLQQFLAQLGTELSGEEGVGAMVGRPTSKLIQREALSEALANKSNVTVGADGSVKVQQPTGSQGQGQGQGQSAMTSPSGGVGSAAVGEEAEGYDIDRLADWAYKSLFGGPNENEEG